MLGARVKALEINVDVTTSGARENKGERDGRLAVCHEHSLQEKLDVLSRFLLGITN